ncbi:hypothetical protein N6H14_19610 [Paenibacillus sp. CC-CFT747]|nr:hypothetical protein N6H14_19610 [Paenibacillus sp. CC-CFT747]
MMPLLHQPAGHLTDRSMFVDKEGLGRDTLPALAGRRFLPAHEKADKLVGKVPVTVPIGIEKEDADHEKIEVKTGCGQGKKRSPSSTQEKARLLQAQKSMARW